MRTLILAALLLVLGACNTNQTTSHGTKSCGLLGCVSSPYLAAKLSPAMIGQPVSVAMNAAGAPTQSASDGSTSWYTWRREQQDGGSLYACTETITAVDGKITDYRYDGHC